MRKYEALIFATGAVTLSLEVLASRIRPEYYAGVEPVSDEKNIFSLLFSDANMELRKFMAGRLPPNLLVN
jgi:hypothetical protein